MRKYHSFPSLLPRSVRDTISEIAPLRGVRDTNDNIKIWLNQYNNYIYRNSLFFKGPLLYFNPITSNNILTPAACYSVRSFKSQCRRTLLANQASGAEDDWNESKFMLFNIKGIKTAYRACRRDINYDTFF